MDGSPGEAGNGDGLGLCGPLWIQAWVSGSLAHLFALCLAEDPTFRCDECDELFQCRLDLRRHKKYACSSAGAQLYEGLGEELKPEGLGVGSDGQAHECKDCERMFPNKYRCHPPHLPHLQLAAPVIPQPTSLSGLGSRAERLRAPVCHLPELGTMWGAHGWKPQTFSDSYHKGPGPLAPLPYTIGAVETAWKTEKAQISMGLAIWLAPVLLLQ